MKTTFHLLFSIVLLALCSLTANAQRQTALYIDDGHGAFSVLTAPLGGGAITLPGASITFPTTNASGALTNDGSGNLSWGSSGSSGFKPAYFNAYTTETIDIFTGQEVPLIFSGTVAIDSGFTLDGFGRFTATATGVYNVEFSVTPQEQSAFAIAVNGAIVPNSQFGCATGTTVIHGNAIMFLHTGDYIALVDGELDVALTPILPGTVTASLSAIRIQ